MEEESKKEEIVEEAKVEHHEVHHKSNKSEKVKAWLKDRYNLSIVFVLILALIVRVYFFMQSQGQALWWDEAEYMATAKSWAFGVPYDLNEQRPPLFQFFGAILFKLGLSEAAVQFITVLLPSVFLVYIVYLLGREIFDARVGLFAATASAFMWSYLFWTARFQPDFLSLSMQLLSLFFFWKLFKEDKRKWAIYAGLFAALGFYFKISALIVPMIAALMAFWMDGFKLFTKKNYWIAGIVFIIALIPFLLWQMNAFGSALAFAPSYIEGTDKAGRDLGWQTFSYFMLFPKTLFFVLFSIGMVLFLGKTGLTFDILMKSRSKRLDGGILSFFSLVVTAIFYLYYIQGVIEDRWVFLLGPFIFYFAGFGTFTILDHFKKQINMKSFALIVAIVLLAIFAYQQIQQADQIIEGRKGSYGPVRDSGLWLRDNTAKDDVVMSISYTQTTAYSERKVKSFSSFDNVTAFETYLEKEKPEYWLLSIFEPHPPWSFQQLNAGPGNTVWNMPYLGSSVEITNGQISNINLEPIVEKSGRRFTLVYPKDQVNGLFIYKIEYF